MHTDPQTHTYTRIDTHTHTHTYAQTRPLATTRFSPSGPATRAASGKRQFGQAGAGGAEGALSPRDDTDAQVQKYMEKGQLALSAERARACRKKDACAQGLQLELKS